MSVPLGKIVANTIRDEVCFRLDSACVRNKRSA